MLALNSQFLTGVHFQVWLAGCFDSNCFYKLVVRRGKRQVRSRSSRNKDFGFYWPGYKMLHGCGKQYGGSSKTKNIAIV